ncbi:MAG: acyl-CoA mutase large subunit family protein [Promethearchaeota archaeon]|jgi:methylmalonyl-CoA mutase N-terminal domain/subunit
MFTDEELKKIKNKRSEWEEKNLSKFIQRGERKKKFETPSGIPLKPVYGPEDIENIDYLEDLGFPGAPPFTRGVYPNMYRGKIWTMRQYSGFADANETNARFKYLISQGQKGLSIAFDLPTQMGYNSDNKICLGEVGRIGVTVNSLKDFENVFKDIALDKVSTSMTINAPTSIILAMYIAIGEKNGVKQEQLTGTLQNDILKEYVARGAYIYPPKPSLRLTADVIEYCSKNLPKFNTISICGYHMRDAGSNAVHELAFTLADGISYVEEVLERGIDIDDFAPRLSFFFTVHNNFFEEIAKLRAARRIWAKLMKDRFKAKKPNSLRLRFHIHTCGSTLTAQQPQVNIIRATLQSLAAILGGTQSLHTCGADEALALPTEDSARLSLRTQQVLAYETGVTDVVDPLGGSYYIEHLTNKLEEKAMEYIDKIDKMGGMPVAIESAFIQKEILNNAYKIQKAIDDGSNKLIGVNLFCTEDKYKIDTFKYDEESEKRIKEALKNIMQVRDEKLVKEKLNQLKQVAKTSENIMPIMIETVKTYATVQEISDVLREVFGEYQSPQIF